MDELAVHFGSHQRHLEQIDVQLGTQQTRMEEIGQAVHPQAATTEQIRGDLASLNRTRRDDLKSANDEQMNRIEALLLKRQRTDGE